MPKTNLYETTRAGVNVETGKPVPARDPRRISVGWSKGQYAQLGIGWVDPAGQMVDELTETDEAGKVWKSEWLDLDRHLINQLIRELRTARDQAFGRDE